MAFPAASSTALQLLSLVASKLPKINPPAPYYAIFASDTFLPLCVPTSWQEFTLRYDTALSDYPQEQGAFQPYNKVKRPQTIDVTVTKMGSDVTRQLWLMAIRQFEAAYPQQLYTLVSPQGIYVDFTLAGLSYTTRQDRGSHLLYLTMRFVEIPPLPSSRGLYDNVAEPAARPLQQVGQIFTRAATAAESAVMTGGKLLLG